MRKQIDYKATVSAQGRNGRMKCIALELMTGDSVQDGPTMLPVVKLAPINSREVVGNCEIEIPVDEVPKLIQMLERFLPLDELVGVCVRKLEEIEFEITPGVWNKVATFPGTGDLQLYDARWTENYLIGTSPEGQLLRIAEDNVLACPYSRG